LAHLTCGSGGGVWLPTPIANEKGESPKALFERMKKYGRTGSAVHLCLSTAIQMLPTPTARDWKDGTAKSCANVPVNSLLGRAVHMLPTPLSSNTKATHMRSGGRPPRSYLPTPTASTYGTQTNPGADPRPSLETLARNGMMPTPTVCGNYNRAGSSPTSGDGLATVAGGALNPTWVEWLMGWPLEWTACAPSETGKSRKRRRSPS
jgi:hypothetical protein